MQSLCAQNPAAAACPAAKREFSLDVLRVLACFMVLVVHACDPYNLMEKGREAPFWGAIIGSLLRPCVPLFIMISGALLLPAKLSMGEFYRRRGTRVLLPFLFWSVLYALVPALFGHSLFMDSSKPYDWAQAGTVLLGNLLNYNADVWHFWYIYVLLGLYLLIPVISPFVASASKRQLQFVLFLWGLSLCMWHLRLFRVYLYGECDWNEHSMLEPFSGYFGYLLLGYYLHKYPLQLKSVSSRLLALGVFAIGFLITWQGFCHAFYYQNQPGEMFGGLLGAWADEASLAQGAMKYLEHFWSYLSINVAMMSAVVYAVLLKCKNYGGRFAGLIGRLSQLSFAIYLMHLFVIYNMHPHHQKGSAN